jgi:hypothetical protein
VSPFFMPRQLLGTRLGLRWGCVAGSGTAETVTLRAATLDFAGDPAEASAHRGPTQADVFQDPGRRCPGFPASHVRQLARQRMAHPRRRLAAFQLADNLSVALMAPPANRPCVASSSLPTVPLEWTAVPVVTVPNFGLRGRLRASQRGNVKYCTGGSRKRIIRWRKSRNSPGKSRNYTQRNRSAGKWNSK